MRLRQKCVCATENHPKTFSSVFAPFSLGFPLFSLGNLRKMNAFKRIIGYDWNCDQPKLSTEKGNKKVFHG
jgi:hypothetical protein